MRWDPEHVLVFNGEIYNYRQLAAELGIEASSDTEVLYEIGRRRAWDLWIHRLRGMYAFVHFDRLTGTLAAGRDPFGIKPLFVRRHPDGEVSFASTVAALLQADTGPELAPDERALTGFLAEGLFPSGTSAFQEIQKVPPGSLAIWTRAPQGWHEESRGIEVGKWPDPSLPAALADSVKAHLVADVEVGVLLSGGVDSTLLAALASRHATRRAHLLSDESGQPRDR